MGFEIQKLGEAAQVALDLARGNLLGAVNPIVDLLSGVVDSREKSNALQKLEEFMMWADRCLLIAHQVDNAAQTPANPAVQPPAPEVK